MRGLRLRVPTRLPRHARDSARGRLRPLARRRGCLHWMRALRGHLHVGGDLHDSVRRKRTAALCGEAAFLRPDPGPSGLKAPRTAEFHTLCARARRYGSLPRTSLWSSRGRHTSLMTAWFCFGMTLRATSSVDAIKQPAGGLRCESAELALCFCRFVRPSRGSGARNPKDLSDETVPFVVIRALGLTVTPVVLGIEAAKRRGISPHWMWFGLHPVTGWIAYLIILGRPDAATSSTTYSTPGEKPPFTPPPAKWPIPIPEEGSLFVRRCLEMEFHEEPESRTFRIDPAFHLVLEPLNSGQSKKRFNRRSCYSPNTVMFTCFRCGLELPIGRRGNGTSREIS